MALMDRRWECSVAVEGVVGNFYHRRLNSVFEFISGVCCNVSVFG